MLERLVVFCLRWPWAIVLLTLALTGGGVYLTATRFAIDTDTEHLFSPDIPWRRNETQLFKEFPQLNNLIVAVIDGKTPEIADDAAKRLNAALQGQRLIHRAWRPDENQYLRENGLLFLDQKDVQRTVGTLLGQRDVLQTLAEDESLRGLSGALLTNLKMVGTSQRGLGMVAAGLTEISDAFEKVLQGEPARVNWEKLLAGGQDAGPANPLANETRRFVLIMPVLDFGALEPGAEAIDLVRSAAKGLGLTKEAGVTLRLTGQTPLADEEFATISENMELNLGGTLAVVTLILFAALRSPKLILAVLATLLAGLAITSGLGMFAIGRFNLISVAFAVLFIGLGVDFGIQFATRYREERHNDDDLDAALIAATRGIGGSLTLAAVSLLAGFFCFLPTNFRGVSELGLIAGVGMIIAYIATLTFLPAAIKLLRPRAENVPVQTASLAVVDHWIAHHRKLVLFLTALVVLGGAPFLWRLKFDSNPMNLRSQNVESVATFLDLAKDPKTAPNTIEALAPSLEAMRKLSKKIAALPEVDHVVTIDTLIPPDQEAKLPLIQRLAGEFRGVLNPKKKPPPSDAETVTTLADAARALRQAAPANAPPAISRFADLLETLSMVDPPTRAAAQKAAFGDLDRLLDDLRQVMKARRVTPQTLPADLRSDWVSANGHYRIEVSPKGDSNDNKVMAAFAAAVQKIAPEASGMPVIVVEAGASVVRAFLLAGLYAFIAIFLILIVALRRAVDVALTLGPLVLAGIMSLEAADMAGLSLNFANIIALPLMFGVGVAFHIYYVIAWRKGVADMLASSLTRAIFFSALTTGTAFGSLFLSSHPGTSSMGELLAISLVFTLLAAFIVVPAFLGPPHKAQAAPDVAH